MTENIVRRRRTGALVAGVLGVVALSFTAVSTLGGFSAAITATGNVSSGTLVIALDNGSVWCDSTGANGTSPVGVGGGGSTATNSSTCVTTLDPFNNLNAVPAGTTTTTTITVKNLGTVTANALTLTPGNCTAVARSDTNGYTGGGTTTFCGKVDVTIGEGTKCLFPVSATACPALSNANNLSNIPTAGVTLNGGTLAAGGTDAIVIKTQLDTSATNAHQGLKASMPFQWSVTQ